MRPHDLDILAKMLMGAFFIMGMVFGGLITLICLSSFKRDDRPE